MNRFNLGIFSIIGLLTILSCKKDNDQVDQSTIYPKYKVTISDSGNSQTTKVDSRLFAGPKSNITYELTDGSLSFNGTQLKNDTLPCRFGNSCPGTYYRAYFPSAIQQGEFEFIDADNKAYVNQAVAINEIQSVDTSYTLVAGDTLLIPWQGVPVQQNEIVHLGSEPFSGLWDYECQTIQSLKGLASNCQSIVGETHLKIFIAIDSIGTQHLGPQTTVFTRKTWYHTTDNPNGRSDGGEMLIEYHSIPFTINVVQ